MSEISSHFPPPNGGTQLPETPSAPSDETPPTRKSYTGWIIGAVVVGVLLLTLAGTAITLTVMRFAQNMTASDVTDDEGSMPQQEPFATGEPGSPSAVNPLECPSQCLTYRQIDETALTMEDLFALGLTVKDEEAGVGSAYPANSELDHYTGEWERGNFSPDECFPVIFPEPIVVAVGDDLDSPNDRIYFVTAYSDRGQWDHVFQSTRVFESTEAANKHMNSLADFVAECTHYSADDADGATWETNVMPAPAVVMPDGVAAVGWQEGSSSYRFYAFDLQRGNIVVRTTLLVYGSTPEEDFRDAVEHLALRLGDLQPLEG